MPSEGQHRRSLLDVVLEQRDTDTTVLNRVIYVGRVSAECNDIEALEGYHKSLFLKSYEVSCQYAGVLMHMGNDTMLHMLEGPAFMIEAFMRQLHSDSLSPIKEIKVILSMEDVGQFAMPLWFVKSLNLPRPDHDLEKKEAIAPHLYRCYKGLLEIGEILRQMQPEEHAEIIENLKTSYHEKLPGNELVESMVRSSQTCSLESYLKIYQEEVQILEESEQIWPMLPGLQY